MPSGSPVTSFGMVNTLRAAGTASRFHSVSYRAPNAERKRGFPSSTRISCSEGAAPSSSRMSSAVIPAGIVKEVLPTAKKMTRLLSAVYSTSSATVNAELPDSTVTDLMLVDEKKPSGRTVTCFGIS